MLEFCHPLPSSISASALHMASVAEIFERAERCFELRVAELLHEKRKKAEASGAILNARKAKRDARTAAGKEKVDGLVRRLADLAFIQEKVIAKHCPDPELVGNVLRGAAGIMLSAVVSSSSITSTVHPQAPFRGRTPQRFSLGSQVNPYQIDNLFDGHEHSAPMFHATQSVVNYVLGSDFETDAPEYGPFSVLSESTRPHDGR